MAVVELEATLAHAGRMTRLKPRTPNEAPDFHPTCVCGWSGPRYTAADEGSAIQAIRTHLDNVHSDGQPRYLVHVITSRRHNDKPITVTWAYPW